MSGNNGKPASSLAQDKLEARQTRPLMKTLLGVGNPSQNLGSRKRKSTEDCEVSPKRAKAGPIASYFNSSRSIPKAKGSFSTRKILRPTDGREEKIANAESVVGTLDQHRARAAEALAQATLRHRDVQQAFEEAHENLQYLMNG